MGFHKASMANIAARAEVAVGVLNYHFGSRQEMLREIMTAQQQDFLSQLSPPDTAEGFFAYETRILQVYLKFLHKNPNYVPLGEEIRLHDPDLYRQGTAAHVAHVSARIGRGIERGELPLMKPADIKTRAYFMLGVYTYLDRLIEDSDFPGDDIVVTTFITTLRAGLHAGPAEPNI